MKEYKTVCKIAGPLVFVEKTEPVSYEEQVSLVLPDGTMKRGKVLDTSEDLVVVQCFESTTGLGRDTGVRFLGETFKMPVSKSMLGRILSGGGKPIDGGPEIVPEKRLEINGCAVLKCVQRLYVNDSVGLAELVVKASLGKLSVKRKLTALKSGSYTAAGTSVLTLVTLAGRLSVAGTCASTLAEAFLYGALCG